MYIETINFEHSSCATAAAAAVLSRMILPDLRLNSFLIQWQRKNQAGRVVKIIFENIYFYLDS
jgi:hypothetical protein